MEEHNFPVTAQEFLELREYLSNLQGEISYRGQDISTEELAHYSVLLCAIETALELAELHLTDEVNNVNEACVQLSKVFGKVITNSKV